MEPLSPRNPRVQAVRRLARQSRERADRRAFVIEGPLLVDEAIDARLHIEMCLHTEGADANLVGRVADAGAETALVSEGAMKAMATTVTPQPVIAVAEVRDLGDVGDWVRNASGHVLVLDRVQDPGNAGTILRSAEASGAAAVIFAAGSVDMYNPKVVRASAGSLFRVPAFQHSGLSVSASLDVLTEAGRSAYATAAGGDLVYDEADLTDAALLLGNEASGVDVEGLPIVDGVLRIPQAGLGESLNVAMAAAVLCFEAARQRRLEGR